MFIFSGNTPESPERVSDITSLTFGTDKSPGSSASSIDYLLNCKPLSSTSVNIVAGAEDTITESPAPAQKSARHSTKLVWDDEVNRKSFWLI